MAKVFIGGLAFATTDDSLRKCFEEFGEVVSSTVITDRESGNVCRSRGFGFVGFANAEDATKAVAGRNDTDLEGRTIRVDIAKDKDLTRG
ncbi:hypothetical protein BDK51DRAFT_10408, partial [Blyttiomyces helicus]